MRAPSYKAVLGACGLAAWALCSQAFGRDESLRKCVVTVYSTTQTPDYYEPWKPGAETQLQGCGTILPGHRILTTAHLVNRSNYIEVQKFEQTRRYVAKVEQVGYDLDLAVLSVDDPDFFEDTQPVEFGGLPQRGDKLVIQGGSELSTKEDTLSGMDMVWGSEGGRLVPALLTNSTVDGASNGCPVFKEGKFVGIPFDSGGKPDKSGSLIPVNVVQKFLGELQGGGTYGGFPDLGFYTQDLDNPSMRDYYKISRKQTGEIISTIFYGGSADGVLKVGDVLTAIDGHPVDDKGYINLDKVGRVPEVYLATFYSIGQSMDLDILRGGEALKVKMPLKPVSRLLDYRMDKRQPTYFLMAGFVFVPLTVNYYSTAGWDAFKPELQDLFFHGLPSPDREQVVLMSHVLPHEINKGYEYMANCIVTKVNGRPISDMRDLVEAFKNPVGAYHVIEVDDFDWSGSTIILDASKADQATEEVMDAFKIHSDRSKDLK